MAGGNQWQREMNKVIREARKQGMTAVKVQNGHWQVTAADGKRSIQVASTPVGRGLLNIIARMRRELDFVWRGH
jgi:hypothetical protein